MANDGGERRNFTNRFNEALSVWMAPLLIVVVGFFVVRAMNQSDETISAMSNLLGQQGQAIVQLKTELIAFRQAYDQAVMLRGERITRLELQVNDHEGRLYRLEKPN